MMTAMVAIISIILIFLFVGRKALPVFTNESVRQTASVKEFFTRNGQSPDGKPAFVWQPVSDRPKYSFVPLIDGQRTTSPAGSDEIEFQRGQYAERA